ncbi:MAG: TetR/AcrR family transcriptional regulator [Brevibacterium aurantiacum]|nr:TetR/AcrR family transcriptional regulator [Brevibacterium aurantiacum]
MLSMCSARWDDRTTAARIRDAAIDLFGRQGFDGTTVRQIAVQAGVSHALVMHHYGHKAALRQTCDDYVVAELFARKPGVARPEILAVDQLVRDALPESPPMRYLSRLLTEPGDVGDGLWDKLTQGTRIMFEEGSAKVLMHPDPDQDAQTQVMLAIGMSLVVFSRHIARGLGATEMDAAVLMRAHAALMRMLTAGAFEMSEQTQRSYDDFRAAAIGTDSPAADDKGEK